MAVKKNKKPKQATREKATLKAATPEKAKPKKAKPVKAAAPVEPEAQAAGATKGGSLVIVESPTKAKTIGKYLGRAYTVKATVGHVRDLPKRDLGVDLNNHFPPKHTPINQTP